MNTEEKGVSTNIKTATGRMVNFRPVCVCALFLVFGILVSYFRMVEERNVWIAVLSILLFPWLALIGSKKKRVFVAYLSVVYLSFFIGMNAFSLSVAKQRDLPYYSGECVAVGTVIEKASGASGNKIVLTDLKIDGQDEGGKMIVSLSDADFAAIEYCDRLSLWLTVTTKNNIEDIYGFRAEAIADKEYYQGGSVTQYEYLGTDFRIGAYLRGLLTSDLEDGMGDEAAAVASAILLGNTSAMEKGLLENIRYGGIAHIFAVSGLHIGSVFAFCLFLFRRNRVPAPIRFLCVALVLVLYGGVCGYSASVVRAIITCLMVYASALLGVKYDPLESLSLAAYVVFAVYPTLLFGVGAQLSFSACFGIALLCRPLRLGMERVAFGVADGIRYGLMKRERPLPADMFRGNTTAKSLPREAAEKCISFLAVSFSAQIGTIPILYLSFGYFSVASVFLNCLYVPLMSLCFSPLLLLSAVGTLFPFAADVIFYAPNVILNVFVLLFHVCSFENFAVDSIAFGAPALICYYCAVLFASDKINLSKWHRRAIVLLFILSCLICVLVA